MSHHHCPGNRCFQVNLEIEMAYHKHKTNGMAVSCGTKVHYKIFLIQLQHLQWRNGIFNQTYFERLNSAIIIRTLNFDHNTTLRCIQTYFSRYLLIIPFASPGRYAFFVRYFPHLNLLYTMVFCSETNFFSSASNKCVSFNKSWRFFLNKRFFHRFGHQLTFIFRRGYLSICVDVKYLLWI